MKILLTGATGYIGAALAEELLRVRHSVTGLARSPESAARLEKNGIEVLRGDIAEPEPLRPAFRAADAVIHTASTNDARMSQVDPALAAIILDELSGSDKAFIYTSGIWTLGDTGDAVAHENTPVNPPPIVAWRTAAEKTVVDGSSRGVRTIMIRPGIVYGRAGGIPAMLVQSARERGEVVFVGTGENRWPVVHVDDLARLYRAAVESGPAGAILHGVAEPALRVREVALAAAEGAGIPGKIAPLPVEEARKTMGPFADALTLDQQVSSIRTMQLVPWRPEAAGLIDDLRSGSYVKR